MVMRPPCCLIPALHLVCALLPAAFSLAADTAQESTAPRPWTVLVYGAADNNADGPILSFMHSVRKALDDDPGVELLFFVDRHEKFSDNARILGEDFTGARLYRLTRTRAERLSGNSEFPEITLDKDVELDSADARNVQRFVAWGKAHYPAQRYCLLIYSHADGQDMCPDEHSGRHMGIAELSDELGPAESVDVLALELCNMGGIEIAYQWRPGKDRFGADLLIAIPNAGPPLDWNRAFKRIRSPGRESSSAEPVLDPARMTPEDFGRLVIDEGHRGRLENPRAAHESAACYDLRAAADVKKAVDSFAVELDRGGAKSILVQLRGTGPDSGPINYTGGGPYVDLYDLCKRAAACENLAADARRAAGVAMQAVDRFVLASFGMSHYKDFEPGRHGVFIVLPPNEPDIWNKRFAWYTPLPGSGPHYGRWSFLADGATPGNGKVENWFELLDSWFDEAGGGVNQYAP